MNIKRTRRAARTQILFLILLSLASSLIASAQESKSASKNDAPAAARTQDAEKVSAQQEAPLTGPPMQEGDRLTFMEEAAREEGREAPSSMGLLVRTLGALALVVGLVVFGGWGLRRFGGARFGAKSVGAPDLQLLTTLGLGDRRSLSVVRFGGRTLLIGATAQTLTLLAEEEDAPSDLEMEFDPSRPPRSVADLLADNEEFERQLEATSRTLHALPAPERPALTLKPGRSRWEAS